VKAKRRWRLLPLLILVPLVVGVLSALMFSALAAARERAKRTKCNRNLHCLLYVCHLYGGDHDERFPPDLSVLFPRDYVTDGELFLCPSAAKATELFARDAGHPDPMGAPLGLHPEHTDYVYVSGLMASDPPDYVLAFDDEWNHEGEGLHLVYMGGQRDWVRDIGELHGKLAKQKGELAAKGREMKLIRPKWSSWPDPSASDDPRAGPGIGRRATSFLAGAVIALIVALLIVVFEGAQPSQSGEAAPEDTGPEGPPKE